ncbi:MAG: RNA polymerase sigma factor [Chloroflexota bacterium]
MKIINRPSRFDEDFLLDLKRGDDIAWSRLTDELTPRLYSYLRYNLPTEEDVEDVLSETMIATVRAIQTFDGRVKISTFVYSIANRKVADFWRKRRGVVAEDSELSEGVPATDADTTMLVEIREDFEAALARLPEVSRQALLLRYHMGLGVDEVATTLGRTYKATESLLSRARYQLRNALAQDEN